jgi:hypothetical protein
MKRGCCIGTQLPYLRDLILQEVMMLCWCTVHTHCYLRNLVYSAEGQEARLLYLVLTELPKNLVYSVMGHEARLLYQFTS